MQKTMNTRKEATGGGFNATMATAIKVADRITECERLGREAHGRGLTAEASTDDRLMALVNARASCTTLDQEPDIVNVFRAWIRGWHAAEQAARLSAAGQEV